MAGISKFNSSSKTNSTDHDFSNRPPLDLDPNTSDWQGRTRTLNESFDYIFSKNYFCDVTFIVSEDDKIQKMKANKMVLSARSSVFYTMFGETWSSGYHEIEVSDVDPTAFEMMLRFLYSDKISLTDETVSEVLYVAKKYLIVALEEKCMDFLSDTLSPENAFSILIVARTFNLERLVGDCLAVIAGNTMDTLQSKDFFNIDVDTLCLILERSDLRISELPLFKAVLRWSEAACQKRELPINPENQRLVLKDAPLLLRFPLMGIEDFASEVLTSGILTKEETISAFLHFTHKSKPSVFSDVRRNSFFVANRFQSEVVIPEPLGNFDDCISRTHQLQFSVDTNIILTGIGLYGSPGCTKAYHVNGILYNTQTSIVAGEFCETLESSMKIFRVMFKQPVNLYAHVKYRIDITIQGQYYLYGNEGSSTTTVITDRDKKVIFQFFSYQAIQYACDVGYKSDVSSGQIPEFLFDYESEQILNSEPTIEISGSYNFIDNSFDGW